MANAIFDLYGTDIRGEIYKKYCNGDLSKIFVNWYFSSVYSGQGESAYMSIIEELSSISQKHISIILSAPGYQKALADLAGTLYKDIEKEYWENVCIWSCPKMEYDNIIWKLCSVGRYADILHIIQTENDENIISTDIKIYILCEMVTNGAWDIIKSHMYEISGILKAISLPKDNTQNFLLLQMEFIVYDNLRHYMNAHEIHFIQEINKEPSLLMEIYALIFKVDDGFEEEYLQDNTQTELKRTMAHLAYRFIHNYHEVPCSDPTGKVDENALSEYFEELTKLANNIIEQTSCQ